MTLNLTIGLPLGLDDLLRAGAGSQTAGTAVDTSGVSLTAVVVPQGSFMDQGLSVSADGKSAFGPAFASQFTQLQAAEDEFNQYGVERLPQITANLTFANGDVASFSFVQAQGE